MYYGLYGFLYVLSLLPLRVLYLLSDFFYLVVYKLLGYRKKVVLHNLAIAFPDKTNAEREAIAARFYHNFCDTFIETIKFISAPPSFFQKHFQADYSVIHDLWAQGKNIQLHLGHNFNWELANLAFPFAIPYKTLVVYLPLNSKPFNRLFQKLRSRFGTVMIAATRMRAEMLPHRNTQYIIGLIADQSPANPAEAIWVPFFGRPTAFIKGPEAAARRNNFPVLFCHFVKLRRGYYKGYAQLVTQDPTSLPAKELTLRYARFLEEIMRQHPDMWLWSHRRWKHEWKPEYESNTA